MHNFRKTLRKFRTNLKEFRKIFKFGKTSEQFWKNSEPTSEKYRKIWRKISKNFWEILEKYRSNLEYRKKWWKILEKFVKTIFEYVQKSFIDVKKFSTKFEKIWQKR